MAQHGHLGLRRLCVVARHIAQEHSSRAPALSSQGVAGIAERDGTIGDRHIYSELPGEPGSGASNAEELKTEEEVRVELAAAFRFFARERMNEGIANHFSYMLDETHFLVNPFGRHFSALKASELVLVDATDTTVLSKKGPNGRFPFIEPSALSIHGAVHRLMGPRARCVMHLHPHYATALSCLEDMRLPPVDQNSARFFNRLSMDKEFGGMGVGDEAVRMVKMMGENNAMLMGSHGCIVVGETVGHCIDAMYYLELSCRAYMTARQTGMPVHILSDEVAEVTAKQWASALDLYAEAMMGEVLRICDEECPNFRD